MDDRIKVFSEKMDKSYSNMLEEFSTIRAGRANPKILSKITVDYYGSPTPLQQVGNITVPEARIIQIQPWESSMLKQIERAINMSDIGINPTNDGKNVRLVIPPLTEERRKELTKLIKKMGEESKVAVRNCRRDANEQLKKAEKAGELTEDDLKDDLDEIQKMTDKCMKDIDQIIANKDKEIMEL